MTSDSTIRRIILVALVTATAATGCAPDPPAAAATVAVQGRCRNVTETGAGILLDNGLILTSAHVVAASDGVSVRLAGRDAPATIVAFDPDNDLAYLEPNPDQSHGWSLATHQQLNDIERGTPASVYVPRDGEITRLDATVVRRLEISTEDIYIDDDVVRPGWEVRYPIKPGDSGGAVVVDGVVIGVIWARSRGASDRAYAIDPVLGGDLIDHQLAAGELVDRDGTEIDLQRC